MVSILCITSLLIYPTFGLMTIQKLETGHVCCPVQDLQVRKARSSNTFLTTPFVTLSKLKFWCLRLICIMEILSTLMRIRSSTGQCLVNSGDSINGPSFCSQSSAWSEHLICKDRSSFLSTLWEPINVTKVAISRAQDTGFCVIVKQRKAKWGPSPSEDFVALGYSGPTELK